MIDSKRVNDDTGGGFVKTYRASTERMKEKKISKKARISANNGNKEIGINWILMRKTPPPQSSTKSVGESGNRWETGQISVGTERIEQQHMKAGDDEVCLEDVVLAADVIAGQNRFGHFVEYFQAVDPDTERQRTQTDDVDRRVAQRKLCHTKIQISTRDMVGRFLGDDFKSIFPLNVSTCRLQRCVMSAPIHEIDRSDSRKS